LINRSKIKYRSSPERMRSGEDPGPSKVLIEISQSSLLREGFGDVCRVCDHYFGEPRQKGTSHRIYKVSWIYPPLINIQNFKGKAKDYQVKQVLDVVDKLEEGK